jgi:hypothetical protein
MKTERFLNDFIVERLVIKANFVERNCRMKSTIQGLIKPNRSMPMWLSIMRRMSVMFLWLGIRRSM